MHILTSALTLYNTGTSDISVIDDLSTYMYGSTIPVQTRTTAETEFYYIMKNGLYDLRDIIYKLSESFISALFNEFNSN